MLKTFLKGLVVLAPWPLKRIFLTRFFGYDIHPTARIGLSWVFPLRLIMEEQATIGNFTFSRAIDLIHLKEHTKLGSLNWITGFNTTEVPMHFAQEFDRRSQLIMCRHSAVTSRHLLDCTGGIRIGSFATLAGYRTQVLTHAIDIEASQQSSGGVDIGEYSFIGTGSILLKGCAVPPHSVIAAGTVVAQVLEQPYTLYGGVPARPLKPLNTASNYFHRSTGTVL